jgi:signal transduction histidine kinase
MKKLLIPLCLLCCIELSAQKKSQALVDSMKLLLPTLKEDSSKVNLIVAMSRQFYYLAKMNDGISYLKEGLSLAEKINWKKGIANCYTMLGNLVGDTGNIIQARLYFEKSLKISREIDSKSDIINNLNNIGRGYQMESDFSNAVKYFFDALKVAEEIKSNEKIALVGTNLTATYILQQNYSKAEQYAKMTLQNAEIAKATYHAATALQHFGIIYCEKKDTPRSIEYFNKAIKVYRSLGVLEGEIECMSELSSLGKPEEGLKKRLEMQDLLDKQNALIPITIGNLGIIGITYYDLAKTKAGAEKNEYMLNAARYLKRAIHIAKEANYMDHIAEYSLRLSKVEEENANFKDALALYKEYHLINDSLFSQEKKNTIAGLEGKHNIALKDDEIAINKLMLANQRKAQWGLIAGLALLFIIGGLLYWQSRSRKKTNTTLMVLNNQLDEANKVKARFFSILSHDLRSPIVNLVNFLHLQKDSPDLLNQAQQTAHRQNISDAAEDLLNNMEAMLLWSKEQMENFRPNIKNIAVGDLFEYIQKFFGQTENVKIKFDDVAGLVVSTDENYLRTIMQNLTSNAIRALKNTPGATIEWKARKEGTTTLLSVTDNGPGIGREQAKTLFDESVVTNEKTGFGFHLIRDLAKAIQYKIAVQSEPGRGTTFILSNIAA